MTRSAAACALALAAALAPALCAEGARSQGKDEPSFKGLFPPDVRTVGIVSVSSLVPESSFVRGTNLLARAGYRVKAMPNVRKMEPPAVRARLFEQAWMDPEIDFLLFSRGGQGAAEVVPLVDWDRLRGRGMRVMGFSDVTVVLGAMLAKGAGRPISGPMVSTLSTYCSGESRERLRQVLDGTPPPLKLTPVKPCAAAVVGKPFAGLVSRFPVLLDIGFLPSLEGRVVFVECTPKYADASESILDGLLEKGVFDKSAAVVFCDFNRDWKKEDVDALFARFAAKARCPVFSGYPYGHVPRSFAVDFGRTVRISEDGVLEWKAVGPSGDSGL